MPALWVVGRTGGLRRCLNRFKRVSYEKAIEILGSQED